MLRVACLPAYNEERTIGSLVKKSLNFVDKVIVCDDGSIDNTSQEAKNAGAIVIKHEKNVGKGAALRTLFDYAKKNDADVVVTLDGDGQFLPDEMPKLIKSIIENKSDIVIGYRFDSISRMPKYRKIGNKVLDKITNIASELPFRDTQSGFRSYSKKAINKIKFTSNGFGADSEILVDASNKGLKISEEKITVIYKNGEKTSTVNPVSHSADVLTSLIELIAIRHPLKLLGIPGLFLIVIGIVFSVVVITIFNDTRYFSIPSTLVSLGALVTGLLFLMMSIILFSIKTAKKREN